jgi:broad-specificity NMP kinase
MIIEFCGLPGVGKSTTARELRAHGYQRVRIETRHELFARNVYYFFQYPQAFLKMLFAVVSVGLRRKRLYPLFMNVFLDTNARIHKAKIFPNAIIDQGHIQGLLSLSHHALSFNEIEHKVRFLPQTDKLFILVASAKVRNDRLSTRGYGVREGEVPSAVWSSAVEENMKNIIDYFQRARPDTTFIVSTERRPEEVIKEILRHI